MPQIGDSNAYCILRVTCEFGNLASMIAECWLEANLNIHHRSYLLRLKNFSQQKSILDRLIEALEIRSLPISLDREGQA
jgi:hypothetical protein